ncbi:hypothetical protein TD95_002245 [Thielaviopsis punctulata]|uniref:Kinetochore protein mis13 n=1 Tax=Thielaviopsis punctulata TaxID=72032 RepID=A0A0F4ZDE3_9PEZI|nr:hypothetical protein TD95_002245 [Thielaviopsis punctulata]
MTTVVRTHQPLQVLSMSTQPERRYSKRLAASPHNEQDGDFVFTRAPKRSKTDEEASLATPPKKAARNRQLKEKPAPIPELDNDDFESLVIKSTAPARKTTRRKPAADDAEDEFAQVVLPKRTRRSARVSTSAPDELEPPRPTTKKKQHNPEPRREPSPPPPPLPSQPMTQSKQSKKQQQNGTAKGRKTRQLPLEDEEDNLNRPPTTPAKPRQQQPQQQQKMSKRQSPTGAAGAKIALPVSDTPIINRNKEMRKKGGGRRRSSLGLRGRRASSLTSMGHSALPHKEVKESEFYKHIEAEGLPEPRRMKQLLTWCGERALSEKPSLGSVDSNAVLGARAIQDQLLKDFQNKSEFSDWFSREDTDAPPVVLKPNPRNVEHEAKIAQLETKVKRLRELKKTWQALRKSQKNFMPPEHEPVDTPEAEAELLEPSDKRIFESVRSNTPTSATILRSTALKRLQEIQSTLEFKVDVLADGAHKIEQRVVTAGHEADRILGLSSDRLREREEREKTTTGTKNIPVMEVLRSLGRILPEGK